VLSLFLTDQAAWPVSPSVANVTSIVPAVNMFWGVKPSFGRRK
jgi:hypothetical protein